MQKLEKLVITARRQDIDVSERHHAFAELVSRFQESAYQWAYGILADTHLAQDAVQEGFVTAYQNLEQLREPAAFAGWFRRIILSQCGRLVRNKRVITRPIDLTSDLPANEAGPAAAMEMTELRDNIMTAIQALPEHEQVVTKLFYLNGYSQKEIARLLELPLTTVKKRLQYARRRLRVMMVSMTDTLAPQPVPQPKPIPVRVRSQYPVQPDNEVRWNH